ncbi:uncharacterized protein F5Z01DRAFT_634446 [Emericellopsis atlantica]|uniref:Uncharacterized protein n=1 Tax=Emericellopsis atlantica TaxID=2614577 RepID=A0A9P7ZRB5_9HYPO|nr:uncharacterized protein F5Z01DRAFT_634446 [Emericellopsis atlantica]KAG9256883.1 hypothetical protein F5Z01DRAFT_634446 [Emericellopsis atlantica]
MGEAEDAPTRKSVPSAPPSHKSSFSSVQSAGGDLDMEDAQDTIEENPESVTSDSDMSDRSEEETAITEAEESRPTAEVTSVADESHNIARCTTCGKSVGGKRAMPTTEEDIDERPTAGKTVARKFPHKSVPVQEATPDMTATDEPSGGDGDTSPLEVEVEQGARSPPTVNSPARECETSPAPAASNCAENAAGDESPVSQSSAVNTDAPACEDGRPPERSEPEDVAQTPEPDEETADTTFEEPPFKSAGDAGEGMSLDEPIEKAPSPCEFAAEPECIDGKCEGSSTPCPEVSEVTELAPESSEIGVAEASCVQKEDERQDESSDSSIDKDDEEERQCRRSPELADPSSGTSPVSSPETSKKRPRSSIGDSEYDDYGDGAESAAKRPRLSEERSADEEMAEARPE